ncbi:MAG: hypothetical protein J2P43_07975, partial [Candidatus Dormibacteraeota bacterium]|nr:hypothetical protein [Candidatus Dormibacteraeota bacterium]
MPGADRGSGPGGRRPVRRRASQRPRTPLERLKDAFNPSGRDASAGGQRYASPPPQQQGGGRRYSPPQAPAAPPHRRQPSPVASRSSQRAPRRRTYGRGGWRPSLPPVSRSLIAVVVAGFLLAGLGGTGAYF